MSLDKTQIIVQTLEGQLKALQERSEAALLAVPEHEGAATMGELLAKSCLGFDEVVESRLEKEDVDDGTKQLIRTYTKNLIVRLHNLCESNAKQQRNQVLLTKGRLKEIELQATHTSKLIQQHKLFEENRERRSEEARQALEGGRVLADDEPIIQPPQVLSLPGVHLPGEARRKAAGHHPPGPESEVDEDAPTPARDMEHQEVQEADTKPDTPSAKAKAEHKPLPNAKPEDVKDKPIPNAKLEDVKVVPLKEEASEPKEAAPKPKKPNRRKLTRGKKKS